MSRYLRLLIIAGILSAGSLAAQEFKPDIATALFHQKIDEAQQLLLAADGTRDQLITSGGSDDANAQLTYLVIEKVNSLQQQFEYDTSLSTNRKLGYIRGLGDFLRTYYNKLRQKEVQWNEFPAWISAFEAAVVLDQADASILPIVQESSYTLGEGLVYNLSFSRQKNIVEMQEALVLKYIDKYPGQTMRQLNKYPKLPQADSLIRLHARRAPDEIITYAQARNTPVAQLIEACQDPLVRQMVILSRDKSGQLYFPFLDKLSDGTISQNEVRVALLDSADYYSLLVKTQIDYSAKMAKGDTPIAAKPLYQMLKIKSMEVYVNTINGLHDFPAPIRFKKIQGLNAQELYYLMVCNEVEIYTSSFMYVYQRMLQVFPGKSSDSLLQSLNYDRYKKFITMASNYNTLDHFLAQMPTERAKSLMNDFVSNLDKGRTAEDIEDAVDVANAFSTIKDSALQVMMLERVTANLNDAIRTGNEKGKIVYFIEQMIMQSALANGATEAPDLTKVLGIPPVYDIKNDMLRDEKGRIVLQMYFYGDAGGRGTFNSLVGMYSNRPGWKTTATPEWVMFSTTNSPVPFVLFANRALSEEDDKDEEAARSLNTWMAANGYAPSITVHRGHSYYLPYTINKMWPTSKVVVLGSCGAYHSLDTILRISPDAYIISSKQVGYGEINVALFSYLVENLRNGKDIRWPTMMGEVATRISSAKKEGYDDYVFPHQNLGAMFIKAYKIALQKEQSTDGIVP